jgi:EF-P beta-lysylation protein EpmB
MENVVSIVSHQPSAVPSDQAGVRGDWHAALRNAIRDPRQLCRALDLPEHIAEQAADAAGDFPLFVPLPYLRRIRQRDPSDPLLRQVLPLDRELAPQPGFVLDPLRESQASPRPGILHKYRGRALLVVTGSCAVHCRYCFRRHFPYSQTPRSLSAWRGPFEQLGRDPTIQEVILSGGDPLTLTDSWLRDLAARLARIDHIRRLRVHTRLPVMIPQRVTDQLLAWLRGTRLVPILVIHVNHPQELDADVAKALSQLVDAGIPLLNQSVLLAGVNDDLATLVELSRRLIDLRVMPYYLHQLDRVWGAAHFHVPVSRGRQLVRQMRTQLPGYAVPRYVIEHPLARAKTVLA